MGLPHFPTYAVKPQVSCHPQKHGRAGVKDSAMWLVYYTHKKTKTNTKTNKRKHKDRYKHKQGSADFNDAAMLLVIIHP